MTTSRRVQSHAGRVSIISRIPQKSARKEVMESVEKDILKLKLHPHPHPPPVNFLNFFDHSFQFNLNQILWYSRQVVPVDLSFAPPPSPPPSQ